MGTSFHSGFRKGVVMNKDYERWAKNNNVKIDKPKLSNKDIIRIVVMVTTGVSVLVGLTISVYNLIDIFFPNL